MQKINIKFCITLLVVCTLFSALNTYAQTARTDAQVEFKAGEGPTYPVDPEDPGTEEETEPPVTGSLAIVSVSHFSFSKEAIPVEIKEKFYDIVTEQPNIQVVDLRGAGTGWNLSARLSGFTRGGVDSLPGSIIHIYRGRPNSLSNSPAPVQVENLALPADDTPKMVMTAPNGAGTGLWVMRWYPEEVGGEAYIQLEVPAGAAGIGLHTATINWTLADVPS